MFRTNNCSSSGGDPYKQLTVFHHCSKHVEDNLSKTNYKEKCASLLVFLTYVYHDAWFRECKVTHLLLPEDPS